MEKLTITKVYRSNKDKKGNLLKTSDGREYTRLAIKTKEYGDRYVSGFGNDKNSSWNVGDTVEVVIEQKGEYLNFSMPKEKDVLTERIDVLEKKVKELEHTIYSNPNIIKDDSSELEEEPPF